MYLKTYIYEVIQDAHGQFYNDVWIPRKKENLEWPCERYTITM